MREFRDIWIAGMSWRKLHGKNEVRSHLSEHIESETVMCSLLWFCLKITNFQNHFLRKMLFHFRSHPSFFSCWFKLLFGTCRFEGLRGFYKGITPNLLKNVPAASITFIVYENVLKLLKLARTDWNFPSVLFILFWAVSLIIMSSKFFE